jgi:hypothetical protein
MLPFDAGDVSQLREETTTGNLVRYEPSVITDGTVNPKTVPAAVIGLVCVNSFGHWFKVRLSHFTEKSGTIAESQKTYRHLIGIFSERRTRRKTAVSYILFPPYQ